MKDVGGIGRIEGHCAGGPGALLARFITFFWVFLIYFECRNSWAVKIRKGQGLSEPVEMIENIQTMVKMEAALQDKIPAIRVRFCHQIIVSSIYFAQSALTHHATLVPYRCRSKPAQWSCHDHSHMAKVAVAGNRDNVEIHQKDSQGFFAYLCQDCFVVLVDAWQLLNAGGTVRSVSSFSKTTGKCERLVQLLWNRLRQRPTGVRVLTQHVFQAPPVCQKKHALMKGWVVDYLAARELDVYSKNCHIYIYV